MTTHEGYLLMADISGYTAYLTSSEQEHATPIISSLLTATVEQVEEPLKLWKLEGDAVLAYTTMKAFPSGETFLGICENLYKAFATQRRNMIANTSCTCAACANIETLDLKIIAHHGGFQEVKIGPMADISGKDVILLHRLAKTDVKRATGIESYALFSDAAVEAMGVEGAALTPYSESIEHFGEVGVRVYDLAAAWDRFREAHERYFLEEADGVATYRRVFPHPRQMVWQALVSPELKKVWMAMLDVTVDRPEGRIGPGSEYHCAHESMDFYYWIRDWRPFDYFSTNGAHPGRPGLMFTETYAFSDVEGGTELRWTMTPCLDESGEVHEEGTGEVSGLLLGFWPPVFDTLDGMLAEAS